MMGKYSYYISLLCIKGSDTFPERNLFNFDLLNLFECEHFSLLPVMTPAVILWTYFEMSAGSSRMGSWHLLMLACNLGNLAWAPSCFSLICGNIFTHLSKIIDTSNRKYMRKQFRKMKKNVCQGVKESCRAPRKVGGKKWKNEKENWKQKEFNRNWHNH